MKWLGVTVGLLLASLLLVGGIYLRDRDSSPWMPPQRSLARSEAATVLASLSGPGCGERCAAELVTRPRPGHWVFRITVRQTTECVDIDVAAFSFSRGQDLSGVKAVACPAAAPAAAGGPTAAG
jgi:hypothetical protein